MCVFQPCSSSISTTVARASKLFSAVCMTVPGVASHHKLDGFRTGVHFFDSLTHALLRWCWLLVPVRSTFTRVRWPCKYVHVGRIPACTFSHQARHGLTTMAGLLTTLRRVRDDLRRWRAVRGCQTLRSRHRYVRDAGLIAGTPANRIQKRPRWCPMESFMPLEQSLLAIRRFGGCCRGGGGRLGHPWRLRPPAAGRELRGASGKGGRSVRFVCAVCRKPSIS